MVALFFIRVRTRLERYCSKSVLLNERKLFEVRKRCLKVCSTIPLIRENRFNPFDFVALAISRFELSSHQNRMTLQNFLRKAVLNEHRVVYSARNFTNRQLLAKKNNAMFVYRTLRCLSNIALLILRKMLRNHSFLMSPKFEIQQGLPMVRSQTN